MNIIRINMDCVGIIPAAGHGTRILPFRCVKELLPIGFDRTSPLKGDISLRMVCQYSIESLVTASIRQAFVIVSDHKYEILRILSDGRQFSINLAYLHQQEVNGLPGAIDIAYNWVKDKISVLVLPDTIFCPTDAISYVLRMLRELDADLVLGVFPTQRAEDMCPVEFDDQCRVIALYDKVKGVQLKNTWGLAVWRPKFAEFLHCYYRDNYQSLEKEITLADVFTASIENRFKVFAYMFEDGFFWDVGKSSSFIEAREAVESTLTKYIKHSGIS